MVFNVSNTFKIVQIVLIVTNIYNSFSWILNILLFLQDNVASPFKKMFLVQHFGSFGLNHFDHGLWLKITRLNINNSPQSSPCCMKFERILCLSPAGARLYSTSYRILHLCGRMQLQPLNQINLGDEHSINSTVGDSKTCTLVSNTYHNHTYTLVIAKPNYCSG